MPATLLDTRMLTTVLELTLLSDDAGIRELCEAYWELDETGKFVHSIPALADRFGVAKHDVPRFVGKGCFVSDTSDICPECQTPVTYRSRSSYEQGTHYGEPGQVCSACLEDQRHEAAKAKIMERENRRAAIRSFLRTHGEGPFSPEELTLGSALRLLSFVSASQTLIEGRFSPSKFPHKLSPTIAYDRDILEAMYRAHLIAWDDSTPDDAFIAGERGPFEQFYPAKIVWRLSIRETASENIAAIKTLDDFVRDEEWPELWTDERSSVWRSIAVQECIEFLTFSVEECRFPLPPLEKVTSLFQDLLADYSVGQVCHIIWRAMQYATHQEARGFLSKDHAINYLLKVMRKRGEDAKEKGWSIYPFTRHNNLPVSTISHWYSKLFLKTEPEEAFAAQIPGLNPAIL
jgi:hypothetical protein